MVATRKSRADDVAAAAALPPPPRAALSLDDRGTCFIVIIAFNRMLGEGSLLATGSM